MNKVLNLIGLATRAGRVKAGSALVEKAIKLGEAELVIIAEDASDNTKKRFTEMADFYETEYVIFGSSELLGKFTGKDFRSVIAIADEGFKNAIKKLL